MSSYKNVTREGFMKNRLAIFLIVFITYGATAGNSAELPSDSKQTSFSNQLPAAVSQTLKIQTKLDQTRAILAEISDLLKQEDQILAGIREQKELVKKDNIASTEYTRVDEVITREIQKLREQTKAAEKELAAQSKQAEQYNRLQAEYDKARKERLECEARVKEAENTLALAQKNLAELRSRFAELTAKSDELKQQTPAMQDAAKALGAERARKAEALTRAKNAAAQAEKAEKERLLLANRMAEFERRLSLQHKDFADQSDLQNQIEKEKNALAEIVEKTRKDEKVRAEDENAAAELRKQLQALQKSGRPDSREGDNAKRLQSRLEKTREQRLAAEEQLKKAEGQLKEGEESVAALTNLVAAAEKQQEQDRETAKTIALLTDEVGKETARVNEINARINKQNLGLQALEDEKARLNKSLILIKEKLGREEKNIGQFDDLRLQLAEQKKIRTDAEAKLQQAIREQEALEKEKEQLNQALVETGKLILKNEEELEKAARAADELHKEKEQARKSADLLREKEQGVKQLAAEKAELQGKLKEAEAKSTPQKEQVMAASPGKDALAVEQDVLNKARSEARPPAGDDAAIKAQVKNSSKPTGSRSKQNQLAQAEKHYELGIQKWDEDDMDGAIAEFKKTVQLNPDAAGAYYNISLACLRQDKKAEACSYAYKAGESYIRINDLTQAARMAVLMMKIDKNSPLIEKLRAKIAAATR